MSGLFGAAIPFVTFGEDHHPRCYVCAGPDDFAARLPDQTLRAILCRAHVELAAGLTGVILWDRRPARDAAP